VPANPDPAGRPPAVRIDDLDAPRFSAEVSELMAAAAPFADQVPLSFGALVDQARAETGLDDFGDDWWREPIGVLLDALTGEVDLSPFGRITSSAQVLQLMKNRLLVQDVLVRHPEVHDTEIERPIIIAGLPRTGTTHLHNLISSDPSLRSLPYWESLEPVLAEAEQPAPGQPDPRLARTEAGLEFLDRALPYFKRMHEMTTWHVHEEIQLLAMAGSTMLFETMATMPSWREWYRSHDQTPAYDYLRTVLKVLQWQRGGTRWVLKSPQHLEQFGPLSTVFPDATVVVTHRDPVSVTASLATMISYSARLNHRRVDPHAIGRYWADRLVDLLGSCVRDRDILAPERSMDVRFHEFMADDLGTIERIYARAGRPLTAAARSAMEGFVADHPRGRHGAVAYDLGDLGLDRQDRREALAFYVERFGVEAEGPA
jgi:hypothetical protein